MRYIFIVALIGVGFVLKGQTLPPKLAKEIYLAMEVCPPAQYSFCHDGTDLGPRQTPYFIELDKQDVVGSYKKGIYSFTSKTDIENYLKRPGNAINNFGDILDSFENSVHSFNTIEYYNKVFNIELRKDLKKRGIHVPAFDGKLKYALFKMTIKYIPVKNEQVIIPNLEMQNKHNELYINADCPMNVIVEVLKFEPVSLDNWLNGTRR